MKRFPWSGFVYELRRALLSIPLIVLTVLIVLAAFGILATIASSLPAPSTFPEESSASLEGCSSPFPRYEREPSGATIVTSPWNSLVT